MKKRKGLIFYIVSLIVIFLPFILWTNPNLDLTSLHEKAHDLGGKLVGHQGVIVGSRIEFDNPNPFVERRSFHVLLISGMPHFIAFSIFWVLFFFVRPLKFFQRYIFREVLYVFMSIVSFDFIANFILMFPEIFRLIFHTASPLVFNHPEGNDFLNLFFRSAIIDTLLIAVFCFGYLFLFLKFLINQLDFRIKRLGLDKEKKKFQLNFYMLFSIPLLLILYLSILRLFS